jgi:hypothetical protein
MDILRPGVAVLASIGVQLFYVVSGIDDPNLKQIVPHGFHYTHSVMYVALTQLLSTMLAQQEEE